MEGRKQKDRSASHTEQKVGMQGEKLSDKTTRDTYGKGQTERENRPDTCKYTPPRAVVLSC